MNFRVIIGALIVAIAVSAGQIFLKLASVSLPNGEIPKFASFAAFMLNPYFLAAMATYGGAMFLWAGLLRASELSKVYPFIGLTFVLVPAASIIFLGEKPCLGLWVGSFLILAGVWIIGRYAA